MSQFRQGDVLLRPATIPAGAKRKKNDRVVVLAEGESTGHAHVVSAAHVVAYLMGVEMYLRVLKATEVRHEEHGPITLPPGDYQVLRQREYTPESIIDVQD